VGRPTLLCPDRTVGVHSEADLRRGKAGVRRLSRLKKTTSTSVPTDRQKWLLRGSHSGVAGGRTWVGALEVYTGFVTDILPNRHPVGINAWTTSVDSFGYMNLGFSSVVACSYYLPYLVSTYLSIWVPTKLLGKVQARSRVIPRLPHEPGVAEGE